MAIAVVDRLETIEVEIMQRDEVFRAHRRRGVDLEQLAEQKAVRKPGERVGPCQLCHVMARGMMLDRRTIEVTDGLEAKCHDHRDDQRLDQEQLAVERRGACREGVTRQRGDRGERGEQQADHADLRTDRRPRHDTRAKAEHEADREQVQQRIVRGNGHDVQQREKSGGGVVADRVTALPSLEVGEIADGAGARIGSDRDEAQQRRERAKRREGEEKGAAEFVAHEQAYAHENGAKAEYGKPHAKEHGNKVAVHRKRQSRRA
jgi:hypothetical protein